MCVTCAFTPTDYCASKYLADGDGEEIWTNDIVVQFRFPMPTVSNLKRSAIRDSRVRASLLPLWILGTFMCSEVMVHHKHGCRPSK